jgi:RNA polymerase sigma-70 factor (ECF subfamily)
MSCERPLATNIPRSQRCWKKQRPGAASCLVAPSKSLRGAGLQVDAQPAGSKQLVEQFMHAITRGDADALIQLLSQDAVLVSDGGGKTRSALRPILSDQRVVAFLLGVWHKRSAVSSMQIVPMNGQAGIMIITEGRFTIAINLALDASRERIERIYWMVNPEKMSHLSIKP